MEYYTNKDSLIYPNIEKSAFYTNKIEIFEGIWLTNGLKGISKT